MKAMKATYLVSAIGLALTACTGQVVDIAKESDAGDKGDGPGNSPPVYEGGSPPFDGGVTSPSDSGDWDGWSGNFAGSATAPPPACASAAPACGAPFPGETPFATSQDAANALVGKWSFCGQSTPGLYPADQLGEEYTSDGTYYRLIAGTGGQLVRDMNPVNIGTWQIDLAPDNSVMIHTLGDGTQRGGGLSACPPSLVLLGVESRLP